MSFFISDAIAAATPQAAQSDGTYSLIMIGCYLCHVLFYAHKTTN